VNWEAWTWDGASWTHRASAPAGSDFWLFDYGWAYDAARDEVVVFGGFATGTGAQLGLEQDQTWVWDGTAWLRREPVSRPSPRRFPGMTYDARRGVVLLFGGSSNDAVFNDTWAWDGTTWTELRLAANPAPESSIWTMTYDAARDQVVRVGNPTGTGMREASGTWTWDGSSWTEHEGMHPRPVLNQQMVSDSLRGRILVFGDEDVWVWDGICWTILGIDGPLPHADGAMVYDEACRQTILFGGYSDQVPSGAVSDTWIWDGQAWAETTPPANPPARGCASAASEYP
jgi:hypothetical protein